MTFHFFIRVARWAAIGGALTLASGVALPLLAPAPCWWGNAKGGQRDAARQFTPWADSYHVRYWAFGVPPAAPADARAEREALRSVAYEWVPPGCILRASNATSMGCTLEEWGTPLRWLWCWEANSGNTRPVIEGGVATPAWMGTVRDTRPLVPLRVVWPALIANIALWTLAARGTAAAARAVPRLRERLRRKGLCRRCGYDRAGLAAGAQCPECGAMSAPADGTRPRSPLSSEEVQ